MQFLMIVLLAIVGTAWVVQQFRRRRVVSLQRSPVSDQLVYELSRIADALDRISYRSADQSVAAANYKSEESSRGIPFSMFGRERPSS